MRGHRRRDLTSLLGVPLAAAVLWLQVLPVQAAQTASTTVTLSDNAYTPSSVTIRPGDTVVWRVPSTLVGICHTVSSDDGLFGSGPLAAGILCIGGGATTYSQTFSRAGVFRYHCNVVAGMNGVVTVAAPTPTASPTPPPPPSPSPPPPPPSVSASPTASVSPTVPASPSKPASPSASTSSPFAAPAPTDSGLAAGSGKRGGPSGPALIAIIAGLVALVCAAGLIALRRSGAW